MILGALLALSALAEPVEVRLCAMVDVRYADARAGDRWTEPSADQPGRGFRFEVRQTGGAQVFPVEGGEPWADILGTHAGCTPPLSLDTQATYDVRVSSEAQIRSNRIRSVFTPTGAELATLEVTGWSPLQSGSVRIAHLSGDDPRWNHLAAIAYALTLEDMGIEDKHMMVLNAPGACCSANRRVVRIGSTDRKFIVTHELGHWIAGNSGTGRGPGRKSPDAPLDGCGTDRAPKSQLTKEYQSQAAVEAIADFYSAYTWNTSEHRDNCEYQRHYPLDFDLDGRMDYTRDQPHTCSGDPWDGDPDPDGEDWLEDMVRGVPKRRRTRHRCDGTLTNRSSQYDWLRYLWAMRTVEDVPVRDLYRIWNAARPDTWNATDDGLPEDMPIVRWETACDELGYGDAHRRQKSHGLDH